MSARSSGSLAPANVTTHTVRALRQVWPQPQWREVVHQHLAFGKANNRPSHWQPARGLLPESATGAAFLAHSGTADILVWHGPETVTTSVDALQRDVLRFLRPTADIVVTRSAGAIRPLHFTAAQLSVGVRWELFGEGSIDDIVADVDLFLNMLPVGRRHRELLSKAQKANGGKMRRATARPRNVKPAVNPPPAAPAQKPSSKRGYPQRGDDADKPGQWHAWYRCGRNGCTFVGRKGYVIKHRASNDTRAKCYGRCSLGCIFKNGEDIPAMRAHNRSHHSERTLCSYKTCPFSFASVKACKEHEERHANGSLWPNGLKQINDWVTEARALTRPILGEDAGSEWPDLSAQNYSRDGHPSSSSSSDSDGPLSRRRRTEDSASPVSSHSAQRRTTRTSAFHQSHLPFQPLRARPLLLSGRTCYVEFIWLVLGAPSPL
ncbi:hypothetical protein JCM3770_002491 [Rhodotorula araucariae]